MQFRFKLRGLLIAVGLFAVILGGITSRWHSARRNVNIVNNLRKSGAFATFDDGSVPPSKVSLSSVLSFRQISVVHNVLSDDVVDMLSGISELKEVQLSQDVTDAGLRKLSGLRSLENLRIDSQKITNDGLAVVADFRRLKRLILSGPQFTDAALIQVAKAKRLQSLQLSGTRVTDGGMAELNGLKSLGELNLAQTKISDQGILALRDLPRLKNINIAETRIRAATVAQMVMDVNGIEFGDWFPANVAHENGATFLSLSGEQIDDDAIPYLLRGLPDTTDLELLDTGITSVGLSQFKELANLKRLSINNSDDFSAVKGLPMLEELSIGSWRDKTVPELSDLPRLQVLKLDVSGREGNADLLKQLFDFAAGASNLRSLVLRVNFDGPVAEELARCGSLVELELSRIALRDNEVKHLAKLKNLQSLTITNSQITDAGARQLDDLGQLRHLKLAYNEFVSAACVSALKLKPGESGWGGAEDAQERLQQFRREMDEVYGPAE